MSEYRVAVISDTQVGSIYGTMPKDFMSGDDRRIDLNPGQAYLYRCWVDMCQRLRGIAPDIIVFNGDEIDGQQEARGQKGTELCLPLIADQCRAFRQLADMAISSCPTRPSIYAVAGTSYHVGLANSHIEQLMEHLGAEPYYGPGTGKYSREVLDLEIDGVDINFAHHISVSGGLYRATAPDREAVWSALAGKEGKMAKADALVRSHVHHYVHVEHESKHAVITPCWQLQSQFMRRHSVYRMLPSLGIVWLKVDPEAKRAGEDPIIVRKVLYKLPPFVTIKAKLPARGESDGEAPAAG